MKDEELVLKRIIDWLASIVALLVALSLPLGYYFNSIHYIENHVDLIASNMADQVSELVYLNPDNWHIQEYRLLDTMEHSGYVQEGVDTVLLLTDHSGKELVRIGPEIVGSSVASTRPVNDGFSDVGDIKVLMSISTTHDRTLMLGLYSLLLAGVIFFGLRKLPMRAVLKSAREVKKHRLMLNEKNAELEGFNHDLEAKIAQSAAELQKINADLITLNEAKSEFVSIVAHDLRTPLTGIKLFSDIMLDDFDNTDKKTQLEYLTIISAETDRLSRLISNILDYQKISAGKMQWNDDYVDVVEALRACARPFNISFESKGIDFEFVCNETEIKTVIDVDRLAQVAYNLLSNALKFTEEGKVDIELSKLKSPDGEKLSMVVSDTGPGMPESQLKKIFEPYEQIEGVPNMGKGTGLGLYITRCVVDRYEGRVWAESIEGQGSSFHIELPLCQQSLA